MEGLTVSRNHYHVPEGRMADLARAMLARIATPVLVAERDAMRAKQRAAWNEQRAAALTILCAEIDGREGAQ